MGIQRCHRLLCVVQCDWYVVELSISSEFDKCVKYKKSFLCRCATLFGISKCNMCDIILDEIFGKCGKNNSGYLKVHVCDILVWFLVCLRKYSKCEDIRTKYMQLHYYLVYVIIF